MLAFYERGEAGTYNIGGGPESAISLLECIQLIDDVTGRKTEVRMEDGRFGDLLYFICNIERARRTLHWEPKIRPKEGVPRLIEWAEENRHLFQAGDSA